MPKVMFSFSQKKQSFFKIAVASCIGRSSIAINYPISRARLHIYQMAALISSFLTVRLQPVDADSEIVKLPGDLSFKPPERLKATCNIKGKMPMSFNNPVRHLISEYTHDCSLSIKDSRATGHFSLHELCTGSGQS